MPKATVPFGEWRPDLALLDNQWAALADGVFAYSNTYRPIPGLHPFSNSSLPSPALGLFAGRKKDGTWQIYAGTATRLYEYTNAGWVDLSKATAAATGTITLNDNGATTQNIVVNGTTVTFGTDVLVGADVGHTTTALLNFLVVSADANISLMTYTSDPAELLANLNERMVGRSGGGFSTALAAHISASGQVSIANAGHLPPYVGGEELDEIGLLVDFVELKKVLHSVLDRMDHQWLNEFPPFDVLNPSAENTRLLYHVPEAGVRFVHPRNWRVVRTTGRQITLDETDGAGLLMTLDTADGVPSAARYLREALKELQERGAKVLDRSGPERMADGIDRFTIQAEFGKEKVVMAYFVIRQEKGAATLAARVPDRFRDVRLKELDGLVRSFTVVRRLDEK